MASGKIKKIDARPHPTSNFLTYAPANDGFRIDLSIPHGHVQRVVGTIECPQPDHLIVYKRCPRIVRVIAMIASRILNLASKLATIDLTSASRSITLAEARGIEAGLIENDLSCAMDGLLKRQARIDEKLHPVAGRDWISALGSSQISCLGGSSAIQMGFRSGRLSHWSMGRVEISTLGLSR